MINITTEANPFQSSANNRPGTLKGVRGENKFRDIQRKRLRDDDLLK
jgi:hypothetical protein